ncbi:MAG: hypothetical protein LUD77_01620 [Clostridiales bacterium]|nr:hypothetical protein [Clostridiales bacterium]
MIKYLMSKFKKFFYGLRQKAVRIFYGKIKLFFIEPKDSEKVLYVIRFYRREGLMSMLYKALHHIEYASHKGYIPYIDTKHFFNAYKIKGENSWEQFFSQPKAYQMASNKHRKVILAAPGWGGEL